MFHSPVIIPIVEPWQGLLIVPALVAILVVGLRLLSKAGAIHHEAVRKGFHVGGGLIAVALPWLFDCVWPLAVLAGVGAAALVAVNLGRRLAARSGGLMTGVERADEIYIGPVYFPLAVLVLFWLARSDVLLYLVPILVLTFADAAAALVGVRYGKLKYEATDGRKSVEGSTAFFLVAFFSAHVPLLLASDLGRAQTLLIGVMFGLLLTMVEAVAWSGLDNLFLPLVGYLLLKTYVGLGVEPLVVRLVVTAALAAIAWLARGRAWNDAGLILAILVGYTCANLGGPAWLLIALIIFVGVAWLAPGREHAPVRTVQGVGAVSVIGIIWVGVAHELDRPELLAAFSGSFAAHLAMIGIARAPHDGSVARRLVVPMAIGILCLLAPYVLIERGTPSAWAGAGGAAAGSIAAAALFALGRPRCERRFGDRGRWSLQVILAAAASLGGLALYLVPAD